MRQICLALVTIAMTACFSFHGPPYGGEGEECWRDPNAPPCDKGLECYDGRCEKPRKGSCAASLDCSDDKACVNSQCASYTSACAEDSDCRADYFCGPNQACRKRAANATACEAANECVSGFCVDGACCNLKCDGVCQSCVASTNGTADGSCLGVVSGTDPDSECAGSVTCNGHGACSFKDLGAACGDGGECFSGSCSDGRCCDTSCDGSCMQCSAAGHCQQVHSQEDSGTCDDTQATGGCTAPPCICNAAGKCVSGGGATCATTANCLSGLYCVEGVCCDAACNGGCMACVFSKTKQPTGHCAAIPAGADPNDACTGAATCNGSGGCYSKGSGSSCLHDYECTTGFCAHSPAQTTRALPGAGICCDQSCDTTCFYCGGGGYAVIYQYQGGLMKQVAAAPGACGLEVGGYDLLSECKNPSTGASLGCTGEQWPADGCRRPTGAACTQNLQCASGACVQYIKDKECQ